jgi:hypothetical protein
MTALVIGPLLGLAAASLGLRTTSVLVPRMHPVVRLLVSLLIGSAFVTATLQLAENYLVYDMGLGLLLSLAPVGIFDLLKWWFRWR